MAELSQGIYVASTGTSVWIRIQGRGTFQNSPALKQYVSNKVRSGSNELVVDLAQCVGMDSTFLGVLAGLGMRLHQQGGSGTNWVINANQQHQDLLRGLGLHRIFNVAASGTDHSCLNLPVNLVFQQLPDSNTAEQRKPLNQQETRQIMLTAHTDLVRVDNRNAAKFATVIQLLREESLPEPPAKT
ncbi:MAG: hypothetical protein PCFJNLEI_01322 [Verrucomicrobiae bacterium]|nr:hypothetical protein [Verrucomicrobiae bacterium]